MFFLFFLWGLCCLLCREFICSAVAPDSGDGDQTRTQRDKAGCAPPPPPSECNSSSADNVVDIDSVKVTCGTRTSVATLLLGGETGLCASTNYFTHGERVRRRAFSPCSTCTPSPLLPPPATNNVHRFCSWLKPSCSCRGHNRHSLVSGCCFAVARASGGSCSRRSG